MRADSDRKGPLSNVRVLEMDAIGPVPFCAMLMAGMGADVIHVARPQLSGVEPDRRTEVTRRGRPSVQADLKSSAGVELVRELSTRADILLEGSRPGVMERLELGPVTLREANPRLVYGRMTGWGQSGPLASTAGHDINYIAIAGALHAIGPVDRPLPPLNLVGDYGGGAMFLLAGVLAAYIEAARTGNGQIVDAAMVDGAASLMALFSGMQASGRWVDHRQSNALDGGLPWYDVYETSDGGHVAVGALEEPFWKALLHGLEISAEDLPARTSKDEWPKIRERLRTAFLTRSRDEWSMRFSHTDACVSPVLSLSEAPAHPHLLQRSTFIDLSGVDQPAPAPRFERPAASPVPATWIGATDALDLWN